MIALNEFKPADEASKEALRQTLANEKDERGIRPLVLIQGPPGCGKTKLARHIAEQVCGVKEPIELGMPERGRWQAVLSAVIEEKVVIFDNVYGRLQSPDLNRFITSDTWSFRPLHSQKIVTKSCDVLVILTASEFLDLPLDLKRRARIISLLGEEVES